MPGSSPKGKLEILNWENELPKLHTILDIGPGWGTYPKLMKQKGQVWSALEVHQPYVEMFNLNKYYEKIHINDMVAYVFETNYDLVILGDVLEHVEVDEGISVLDKILKHSNYCIISLPLDEETGVVLDNSFEYWKNPNEKHLARWSNKQFTRTICDLDAEIIGMKKFKEIAVYLVSGNNTKNFLEEDITLFDRLKHRRINFDAEYSLKNEAKKRIIYLKTALFALIPSRVKKIIKQILRRPSY